MSLQPGPEAPLDVCDRVLELVGDHAEAAVTVWNGRSALTRFANSAIHQNVAEEVSSVEVNVVVGGRPCAASTTRTDEEGLRRLVDNPLDGARTRPVDPARAGLAPAAPAPPGDRYDEATATAPPAARAAVVRDFVDAGPGMRAAGYCDTVGSVVAFANSAGQRLEGRTSRATVEGVHRNVTAGAGTADGGGQHTAARLGDLAGEEVGRQAADKANARASVTEIEPGVCEVILEPLCVADILWFLAYAGFNGKAHAEGQSFVELGQAQFDSSLTIRDDATDPRAVGLAFDAEGTPKRPVDLVAAGVCAALAHDRRTALAAGTESTGHRVTGGDRTGPVPTNLFLSSGSRSRDDLIAGVEHGLLVTEFWYTRLLDPKTQVVTGLTRNGTFLVEKGKLAGAVPGLRFTQSYVDALAPGNVLGIGDDGRLVGEALCFVPSLHLRSWRFTGGPRG